jgi:hypothetical protein
MIKRIMAAPPSRRPAPDIEDHTAGLGGGGGRVHRAVGLDHLSLTTLRSEGQDRPRMALCDRTCCWHDRL